MIENEIKVLAGEKVDFPKLPDFIDLNILNIYYKISIYQLY